MIDLSARLAAATLCLFGVLGMFIGAVPLAAQELGGDPAAAARIHLGPVAMTPTVSVSGLGRDPNVFNEAVDPKSDFTATFRPTLDAWLLLGPARATITTDVAYTYFRDFADQRTVNTGNTVRFDLPLSRLRVFASGAYVRARDRPTLDIDVRVRRSEKAVRGGLDAYLGSKSTISVDVEHAIIDYASGSFAGAYDLEASLTRTADTARVTLQHTLTPLTSFVANGSLQQTNFPGAPDRDNSVMQVTAGLSFKPLALLVGGISFGLLTVAPVRDVLPSSETFATSVDLGYEIGHSTRVGVVVTRGVNYSADPAIPFSLQTGYTVAVAHYLSDRWDLSGSGSRSHMSYASDTLDPARLSTYLGGLGYRLTPRTHISATVEHLRRTPVPGASLPLATTRAFTTITHGL